MEVPLPSIRKFPLFLRFSHPAIPVPDEMWEIGVANEDNLSWCILLAYLSSIPEGDNDELKKAIQCFDSSTYREFIERWVKEYNPFLHRKAPFYDENLRNLLMLFKQKVEGFWERNNMENIMISHNDRILQAASTVLSCRIIVISESVLQIFLGSEACENILIFYSDSRKCFSFAMSEELGDRKQRAALQNIFSKISLAKSKTEQKLIINNIGSLPDIKNNLLISLLNSDLHYVVSTLLKSPYVIEKLSEAGFPMDPTMPDRYRKCALIYAVLSNKSELLYCVYYFTVNYCVMKGALYNSNRAKFTKDKFKNTVNISTILRDQMKCDGKMCTVTESRIDELEKFNDFFSKILNLPSLVFQDISQYRLYGNHKFSNNMSDAVSEAVKIRCVILRILKSHEEFYCWNKTKEKKSEMYFDEFCKHADYFYNLDYFCALKLFDNFYTLKERIKLEKEIFEKLEASFFFYIYCSKYFESMELKEKFLVSEAVSYQKRLSLISEIQNFVATLKSIELTGDIIIETLPEDCIHTLTNLPEIYDEFFTLRLEHYLNAAMSVNVNDSKFILVIERALQVIGESVKDVTLNFVSIQNVVSLCLPKDFIQHIKTIRDDLSHLKPCYVARRIRLENDQNLFSGIRYELEHLQHILKPVFLTQKYKLNQFILFHLLKAVNEAKNFQYSFTQTVLDAHLTDSNETDDDVDILDSLSEYFDYINLQLLTMIAEGDYNQSNHILTRSMAPKYKYLLENILKNFKSTLNEPAYIDMECNITRIKEYLYAIDYFLDYVKTDKSVKNEDRQIVRHTKCRASTIVTELKDLLRREKELMYKFPVDNTQDFFLSKLTLRNVLPKDIYQNLENIISDYENLIETIFENIIYRKSEEKEFFSITKTWQILSGKYFLCKEEEDKILQEVSNYYKEIHKTWGKLKSHIDGKWSLTRNELEQEISKLELKNIKASEFVEECLHDHANALDTLESIPNYYGELLSLMEKCDVNGSKYTKICNDLNLEKESCSRVILKKLVVGSQQNGNQLQYLRDRTKMLYSILEEKIEDIKELWSETATLRKKDFIQGKVVEMYLNDPLFQAAIEVLLFDCMNILDNKKLKNLWRKTTNLFGGINLRNVLGHGNPLLESLGKLLDPSDIPSELVQQMLPFISDGVTMDAILDIANKRRIGYTDFKKIMNDKDEEEFKNLIKQIKKCELWEKYASLIPKPQ